MTNTTKKIVINKCFGGFGLSAEAFRRWCELSGAQYISERDENLFEKYGIERFFTFGTPDGGETEITDLDIHREDENLIKVVEEMGEESWGECAELKIIEIPMDVEYDIHDYDGLESIHEKHRVWS